MTSFAAPFWWDNNIRYALIKKAALRKAGKETPHEAEERFDSSMLSELLNKDDLFYTHAPHICTVDVIDGYCIITYRTGSLGVGQRQVDAFKLSNLREDQKEVILKSIEKHL